MTTANEIFEFMCSLAPLELQLDFDNSGFLVGHRNSEVKKVLTALDVTSAVIDEAVSLGVELIIAHHPVIWNKPHAITDDTAGSSRLLKLIENGIGVICMHTNLDIAEDGVNDALLAVLGAERKDTLDSEGCGRTGILREEMSFDSFLTLCRERLKTNGLRYYSAGKSVKNIAVMGGSGGSSILDAYAKGCDTYITADLKYHDFQLAEDLRINLIDGDHFCTENPVVAVYTDKLRARFPELDIRISAVHKQIVQFA